MKILPLIFSKKAQHVVITRTADESYVVTEALNRLYPVESMLKSYAKANGVDLFVSSPKSSDKYTLNNLISLTLSDPKKVKSNTANFAINYNNDRYTFTEVKNVELENLSGEKRQFQVKRSFEDNFIRAFFRTFENLTKQVKSLD